MTRLYELAKELDTPSKDLLQLATKVGIEVKGSFTTLDADQVKLIKNELKNPGSAKPASSTAEAVETAAPKGRRVRRVISVKTNDEGVKLVSHKEPKAEPEPEPKVEEVPAVVEAKEEIAEPKTETSDTAESAPAESKSTEKPASTKEAVEAPAEDEAQAVIRRVKPGEVDSKGKVKIGVVSRANRTKPPVVRTAVSSQPAITGSLEPRRFEDETLKGKKPVIKGKDQFGAIKGGAHKNLKNIDIEQRSERAHGRRKYAKFAGKRREPKIKHTFQPRKKDLVVGESISISDLAGLIGVRAPGIIKSLINLGIMATITDVIEGETAALVAQEHQIELKVEIKSLEDSIEQTKDVEENLSFRPPVVTIMGHVDHGKTSLLDRIRSTNVTGGEAGGITQHIGAYHLVTEFGPITFLDTPGHEAFTAMRARGADATDIVILVVAADDGPRPQTLEAIHHAKEAGVELIVAINKIDKEGANPDKVKQELMSHELVSEEYGGDTAMIPVSAHTGEGLDKLMESILLHAEIMELKANPNREAVGVVIESKVEKGRGNVATVLIQNGTLKIGDNYVVGSQWGRVRAVWGDHGNKLETASASIPVEIVGLNGLPRSGDSFIVGADEKQVRQIAEARAFKEKESAQAKAHMIRLENLFEDAASEAKELNLILKTDVAGSMEALRDSLTKLGNEEVSVRVIHAAVGGITRTDVVLAAASKAIVIGFNTRPDNGAKQASTEEGVEIRQYSVIYDAIEDVTKALEGMLAPIVREELQGKAEVLEAFNIPKIGLVAGCKVTEGKIVREAPVRVIRDNVQIHDGKLSSLRRFKDNVKDVAAGFECGIGIQNYKDIRVGDVIECYQRLETSATL